MPRSTSLGRPLALDLGARNTGWAAETGGNVPAHGLIQMPGIDSLPALLVATRNALERLIVEYEPDRFLLVPALARSKKTSVSVADAQNGMQAVVYLVAGDNDIAVRRLEERSARKAVLGRGDFSKTDPRTGMLKANGGREAAKDAVLDWCARAGYEVASHDEGDALVLLAYERIMRGCPRSLELSPPWSPTPAVRRRSPRA